ncbi:MAG: hypothetical protein GY777_18690 [Candidatus Brocadiaceae bacterium]|nr:hypothetical protein [Candidatus Brocadiaceae bacterium]
MKQYYDIHCHAFTVDHIPINSIVNRLVGMVKGANKFTIFGIGCISTFLPRVVLAKIITEKAGFLPAMDIPNSDIFESLFENAPHIRNELHQKGLIDEDVNIDDFDVVFTPLMMPFRDAQFSEYDKTKSLYSKYSPDTSQFEALKSCIHDNKGRMKRENCFILPFVAVDLGFLVEEIEKGTSASHLIEQYILPFVAPESARTSVHAMIDHYNSGDAIDDIGVGVKLYPSLETGFTTKVGTLNGTHNTILTELLKVCSDKRIPVTTHAGQGGFKLSKDKDSKSSDNARASYFAPAIESALAADDSKLRLNFAHFGGEKSFVKYFPNRSNHRKGRWTSDIVTQLNRTDTAEKLFTDLSNISASIPRDVAKGFNDLPVRSQQVLWGTDWPMALMERDTYKDILTTFLNTLNRETGANAGTTFQQIAETNPEAFLFK